jgi:hypothetical protein
MILLLLMGLIVAIPKQIAYYETGFYRYIGKNRFKSSVLEPWRNR